MQGIATATHGMLMASNAACVDGLIVEGGEGGGFKNPNEVASMVLLPLVRSRVDVPIIAAGGFVDGKSMAAAFALGAEGVQMGTRMVSALESPVHAAMAPRDEREKEQEKPGRPAQHPLNSQYREFLWMLHQQPQDRIDRRYHPG